METIREVFSKPIDRRIEEVIKVDQADEETVLEELQEYVITESIGDHFNTVYKAIADAQSEPHEGIGIWVSGFFGSGKSSFAKIIGYTVGGRTVCGQVASQVVKAKAQRELSKPQADTCEFTPHNPEEEAMTIQELTIAKIQQLPESLTQEVSDFIDFLLVKQDQTHWEQWIHFREALDLAELDLSDYLQNLETYEERLTRGDIRW
jgi:hypothetical protein